MKTAGLLMSRFATVGLALVLAGGPNFSWAQQPASDPQPATPSSDPTSSSSPGQGNGVEGNAQTAQRAVAPDEHLPDSPGTSQAPAASTPLPQPSSRSEKRPSEAPRPVGTAAAEAIGTGGTAASQPSGVAIAPAKQRRARSLLIKVGALVGAGVAIGTVYALSAGTSSKPPGSH